MRKAIVTRRLIIAASVLASLLLPSTARAELTRIEMKIAGMDCATCAHGVSVAIRKLLGVDAVDVSLDRGLALIQLRRGNRVTLQELRQLVKHTGFASREATVTVIGELQPDPGGAALSVTGPGTMLTLIADTARPNAYKTVRERLAGTARGITLIGVVEEKPGKDGRDRLVVHEITGQ